MIPSSPSDSFVSSSKFNSAKKFIYG
jgi:hypothetical protein